MLSISNSERAKRLVGYVACEPMLTGGGPTAPALPAASPMPIATPAEQTTATNWLNSEGTLDESMPLDDLLRNLIQNKGDEHLITKYAERLCGDCFAQKAASANGFYDSTDPYDIGMDLRNNEGLDTDALDIIDTLSDCNQRFNRDKARWIELAAADIDGRVRNLVSNTPDDCDRAYKGLRARIVSFFVDEAYGLMKDDIRRTFREDQSSSSDSDPD